MEWLAVPLVILFVGISMWLNSENGLSKVMVERRMTAEANARAAEANARAEEARLEQKRLERADQAA